VVVAAKPCEHATSPTVTVAHQRCNEPRCSPSPPLGSVAGRRRDSKTGDGAVSTPQISEFSVVHGRSIIVQRPSSNRADARPRSSRPAPPRRLQLLRRLRERRARTGRSPEHALIPAPCARLERGATSLPESGAPQPGHTPGPGTARPPVAARGRRIRRRPAPADGRRRASRFLPDSLGGVSQTVCFSRGARI
jgi:hypothetical protein